MSAAFTKSRPQTTKVLIRTDPDAASVNDDSADAQRRQGKQALRQTRSKHALEEPLLQATPRQKRSRFVGAVLVPFQSSVASLNATPALQVGTSLLLHDRTAF